MGPATTRTGSSPPRATTDGSRMQCMQVWGGSGVADLAVSTTGLDLWLYSRPYGNHETGGDVYFLSSCSSGRITRLALGDVCGHGAQVTELADRLRGLMRRHINRINQQALVESLNEEFVDVGDPATFATGLMLTFFVPTGTLSLSNAGHPPPLRWNEATGWQSMEQPPPAVSGPADVPLGLFAHSTFSQVRVSLGPGDRLLLFTDALEECVDEAGEPLGRQGLIRMLDEIGPVPADQLIPSIVDAATRRSPRNLADDDATLLLVTPNGASVPLRDNLLAPVRLVRGLLGGR